MDTVESLRDEKARLEKELERIKHQLDEQSGHSASEIDQHHPQQVNPQQSYSGRRSHSSRTPASKSGYLSKWQDRYIGWGGTKWDLRFVRLEKGRLGYYKTHDDAANAPRYLLTLKNCAVRDDGSKPNKRFRPKVSGMEVKETTPGAYFHVFSIYQRPKLTLPVNVDNNDGGATTADVHSIAHASSADLDDEDSIVPLLRFSTTSLAEKEQWMDLLAESCAYCDSDDFDENEMLPFTANQPSSQHSEHPSNGAPVPGSTQVQSKGTIPALYFAPAPPRPPSKIGRSPSHSSIRLRKTTSSSRLKYSKDKDSAKSNSKRKSGYPPSKPMHRRTESSYLSHDSPTPNYRGLLNLGLIILVISNFRILLGTMREYGFVLTYGFFATESQKEFPSEWKDIVDVPFVGGMALLNFFVIFAYIIEAGTSRKVWNETLGISLHVINTNVALFLPMMIVWSYISSPVNGAVLLMTATVLWMKLISYVHANADYRHFPGRNKMQNIDALIQNVDGDSTSLRYPRYVDVLTVKLPFSFKKLKNNSYVCATMLTAMLPCRTFIIFGSLRR